MSTLRVGMLVRYIGKICIRKDGSIYPSPSTGKTGVITEDLGVFDNNVGIPRHFFNTTIDSSKFAGRTLMPINPDNEAWGSYDDMIKDLSKEEYA
jgi:hypothetical protein